MYHGYGVSLSDGQALKLRRGHAVRLKHENLEGHHKLDLTPEQIKKLEKAKRAGKGATLKLHPEQISHMLVSGGSVFSKLKSVARKFKPLLGVAKDVLQPVGEALLQEAGHRLKKKASEKAMELGKSLLDQGLKKVGAGRRKAHKAKSMSPGPASSPEMEGMGMRRHRVHHRVHHKLGGALKHPHMSVSHAKNATSLRGNAPIVLGGFSFGDFVSGVSSVGKAVAPVLGPVAKDVLLPMAKEAMVKRLVGKGVRKHHKKVHKMPKGMGLFAPGMAR